MLTQEFETNRESNEAVVVNVLQNSNINSQSIPKTAPRATRNIPKVNYKFFSSFGKKIIKANDTKHQNIDSNSTIKLLPKSSFKQNQNNSSKNKKRFQNDSNETPQKCLECGKSYVDINKLKLHQSTHIGQNSFKCLRCNKSFRNIHFLKAHDRQIHQR